MNESSLPHTSNPVNTINGVIYCQWPIFIHNCVESNFFINMYYGNLIFSVFVSLLSGFLLIRRLRIKKELFIDGVIAPLEGFLGFTFIGGILRIICSCIYIFDAIPSNYAIRELIEDAQWAHSVLACLTYLAGVFRALPSMAFHQPSSTTQTTTTPAIIKNLWIPSTSFIKRFYWSFAIVLYVSVQSSSFLSGPFRLNQNSTLTDIFYTIRSLSYVFICLILFLGYGTYGRLLVKLTIQSFELIQGPGGIVEAFGGESQVKDLEVDEKKGITRVIIRKFQILNKQEKKSDIELKRRRFRWQIRKMQLFNLFVTLSFFFWSIQSFIISFWHDWAWSTLSVSKSQAFVAAFATGITSILMLLGILLSEMTGKKDTNPNTYLTISNSNILFQSISVS